MCKSKVKKLIKNYLKKVLRLKVVNINDDHDIWLAVNECGITYQIRVYYDFKSFNVVKLSQFTLNESDCYIYNDKGEIILLY